MLPYFIEAGEDGSNAVPGYGDMLSILRHSEASITGTDTATLGRMHVCSGTTSDYSLTLPTALGNAGKFVGVRMSSALTKLVTLDGNSTETIDEALTRIMWAGESAILMSDGTQWVKVAGKSIPMRCTAALASNTATAAYANAYLAVVQVAGTPGMVAGGAINIIRPGLYRLATAVRFSNVPAAGRIAAGLSRVRASVLTDFVTNSESGAVIGTYPFVNQSLTLETLVADAYHITTYHELGVSVSIAGSGTTEQTWCAAEEVPQW